MFYLTMHSTHFIYGYMASDMVKDHSDSEKERERNVLFNDALNTFYLQLYGRKERFYLTTHSTHFTYGYMASDMVKDHSDSEREREMFYLMTHSSHFIYGYMEGNVLFNNALNTFYLRLYGRKEMFYLTTHSTHFTSVIWKEGNVLFNDALNTFYLRLYGRKEMFYLTTHSTHFIYGYMEGRKCFI